MRNLSIQLGNFFGCIYRFLDYIQAHDPFTMKKRAEIVQKVDKFRAHLEKA